MVSLVHKDTAFQYLITNQQTPTNSMTRDEVAKKVEDIIVDKLNVDASEVKDEANFTLDLGADSLDTVELIMEFEKEFDIKIEDDEAQKIQTVGDAVDHVLEAVKDR